jgi:hypothetical protein
MIPAASYVALRGTMGVGGKQNMSTTPVGILKSLKDVSQIQE